MFRIILLIFLCIHLRAEIKTEALGNAALVDYPVVFVHGIANRYEDWRYMAEMVSEGLVNSAGFDANGDLEYSILNQQDNSAWLLSYYEPHPVSESLYGNLSNYSSRLAKLIKFVKQQTKSSKVIIIAHSMGGLVSRHYMSSNQEHWESVHRILTVGTPHEGIYLSVPVVGQLQDLGVGSNFIRELDQQWAEFEDARVKWSNIAGVSFLNSPLVNGLSTDFAGPGFVPLYSAIPFGEWKQALEHPKEVSFNTPHFAYRLLLHSGHRQLLKHPMVYQAIQWIRQQEL